MRVVQYSPLLTPCICLSVSLSLSDMKIHHIIVFSGFLILVPLAGKSQTSCVEISLGLEKEPSGLDSFLPYYQPIRPKIALALSGGGARGLAQIGVLKVLERCGLPIDGIAGTSMGAVVGGLYALGYTAAEIESLASSIQWNTIIQNSPPRQNLFLGQKDEKDRYILQVRFRGFFVDLPSAYTAGQNLNSILTDLVLNAPRPYSSDFNLLQVPFRAVATDLYTGKKVVLKSGSLVDALRSSMAIPLLFTPVPMDNALLADGGLVQNLPVEEALSLGADIVIAVDTSSPLRDIHSMRAPWELADQVTTIMQQERTQAQLESASVSIRPALNGISNTDFDRIDAIIRAGEEAAERAVPQIEHLLEADLANSTEASFSIIKISLSGCQNLDPAHFLSMTGLRSPSVLSTSRIAWAGRTLLQTGYFQKVTAFYDTSAQHLSFQVIENPFLMKIEFRGNHAFSDSVLLACMESTPNEVLNLFTGRRDRRALIDTYRRVGFGLAHIDSISIRDGTLQITIDEGKIDRIELRGMRHTRPFVVLRDLPLKPGDLFNTSLMKNGIENIYSTGYFEDVRFNIDQRKKSNDLVLHLTERGYTLVQLSLRHDLERYTQGAIRIVGENLFGSGNKGSIFGLVGNRDKVVQGRLWSDRFLKSYLTYGFNLSAQQRSYSHYQNYKQVGRYRKSVIEGSFIVGQHMRKLGTLSVQLQSESIRLRPLEGENIPDEKYTLRTISLHSEVDTRDRLPFPSTGKRHILEYETAGRYFSSDISYTKISSSMESYYSLLPSFVFHPRIYWGTADQTIPFAKQYRLGGLDSFLGLPEEAFVGKRFISTSAEFRCRIPWPRWLESYLSVRYDWGGIWSRYAKITATDFKQGIGAVFSLNTPLGPFHIGYGRMSDGFQKFYFSAGHSF